MTRRIDRALELAGLPALERSAWVEVDIDVLIANAGALLSLASPAALGAVVKADGYGHGLEMAGRCAVAGGAEWLCVADSAEAARLRRDGYEGRIFVLYPVPPAIVAAMARLGVDVTVGSTHEASTIAEHLAPGDPILSVHLEIDTGMTRGGVFPGDAVAAASAISDAPTTSLAGVWTHLAAPEDPLTAGDQLGRFEAVLAELAAANIDPGAVHVAASGELLAAHTDAHTLVRPGLALYGVHPGAGDPLPPPVAPALAVRAHPVRIAEVAAGTAVGYAGTWTAQRVSIIATLPVGYADGWSRASSPGTSVLVEGERAPVVGRVSSDSLTVDVTGIAEVGPDSEFTLLGSAGRNEITADAVAEVRRTISWEVLQQLGARLARVYTSGPVPVALRAESTIRITEAPGVSVPPY
ncbi:MAG: alanine racemase [Acidimicrobiia bacterium]|nr:alanine racemase [Acidimicrobiia bacterium]